MIKQTNCSSSTGCQSTGIKGTVKADQISIFKKKKVQLKDRKRMFLLGPGGLWKSLHIIYSAVLAQYPKYSPPQQKDLWGWQIHAFHKESADNHQCWACEQPYSPMLQLLLDKHGAAQNRAHTVRQTGHRLWRHECSSSHLHSGSLTSDHQ